MDPWTLAGPAQFVDVAASRLEEGISIALMMSPAMPPGIEVALADRLERRGLGMRRVDLAGRQGAAASPRAVLLDGAGPPDPALLARACIAQWALTQGVWWVEGLDPLAWAAWRDFVPEFCQEARNSAARVWQQPRLCIAVPPGAAEPREEAGFAILRWDGQTQRSDVQQLVARIRGGADAGDEPRILVVLHRALVVELAGSDLMLARHLCAAPLASLCAPETLLCDYGERVATDGSRDWYERVDGDLRKHSVGLACAGETAALARRVWRAQIAVLFPWLEEIRLALVDQLIHRLKLPWRAGDRTIADPLDLELTHLRAQAASWLRDGSLASEFAPLVELRNRLAHRQSADILLLQRVHRRWLNYFPT